MNLQEHNSSTVAVSCVLVYLTVKDYGVWSYHFMANRRGKSGSNDRFYFLGFQNQITEDGDWSHEIKRCLLLGRKAMTNLDNILKSRDLFTNKGPYSQSCGFSSSHVWTWELDHKEGWVLKKMLESPLDSEDIKPVNPKGNQPYLFIHWKDWYWSSNTLATWCEELTHWKKPWWWKRLKTGGEGMTEDEMAGWHHQLDGHEFRETPGVGDVQGGLACCSPWGCKESDTTEWLNWTDYITTYLYKEEQQDEILPNGNFISLGPWLFHLLHSVWFTLNNTW